MSTHSLTVSVSVNVVLVGFGSLSVSGNVFEYILMNRIIPKFIDFLCFVAGSVCGL